MGQEEQHAITAEELFRAVVHALSTAPQITKTKMFGSEGLKVGSKVFAVLVKGKLVVKLPAQRVARLVASGVGVRFDPGMGRVMKEWVALEP
ncbi:MAG: TfoX/Sxy family protein, partial [Chloroflexi bacterium]|nr:TfoX/Sxy family protein [Chloroflexota bacterium]